MTTLTDKQLAFINYYFDEAGFSPVKAARLAKYSNPDVSGTKVLQSPNVAKEIKRRLNRRAKESWYKEEDIMKSLWEEAHDKENPNSTQAARISALVWLGKHIGMWNDIEKKTKLLEKERQSPRDVYNIINYAGKEPKIRKKEIEVNLIENKPDESFDNIEITNYSKIA